MGYQPYGTYGSVPMDLLHGWCSGIIKSMLQYTLSALNNMEGIRGGVAYRPFTCLENRMNKMPRFPYIPGFCPTKFNHGVSELLNSGDKKRNLASGGSSMSCGGGYHSKHLVTMYLHMIMCCSTDNSVAPNYQIQLQYKSGGSKKLLSVNPLQIILKTAYIVLSTYFELRRVSYTAEHVRNLNSLLKKCVNAVKCMFALKQFLTKRNKPIQTIKLHMIQHMQYWIEMFGSPLGFDTERWESFMSNGAKQVWKRSKKSKLQMQHYMMTQVM